MAELSANFDQELLALICRFSKFGETPSGGVSRLAASNADKQARDYLCNWFESNGFKTRIDPIGNIFGILDLGANLPEKYFLCGSHLDSQPEGGRFDGVVGVVCACIAGIHLRSETSAGRLNPAFRYFVVVNWTSEEGARFQPSLIGSCVFSGLLNLRAALNSQDSNGSTLEEELAGIGYIGDFQLPSPTRYLEIHVEQGPVLEQKGCAFGLVESSWGAVKITAHVTGKADHTGPTPMDERRDALLVAAHIIVEVEELASRSDEMMYSSVAQINVFPNSPNTIASEVELKIEFRSANSQSLSIALDDIQKTFSRLTGRYNCAIKMDSQDIREVTKFDKRGLNLARRELKKMELSTTGIDTVAGHDAVSLQSICPSTLIFIPSQDGVSHSPDEYTSNEDICAGYQGFFSILSSLIHDQNLNLEIGGAIA